VPALARFVLHRPADTAAPAAPAARSRRTCLIQPLCQAAEHAPPTRRFRMMRQRLAMIAVVAASHRRGCNRRLRAVHMAVPHQNGGRALSEHRMLVCLQERENYGVGASLCRLQGEM